MDIRFEQVDFTYQPNTPFEQRALFDINMTIKENSYTALGAYRKREINLTSAFECAC